MKPPAAPSQYHAISASDGPNSGHIKVATGPKAHSIRHNHDASTRYNAFSSTLTLATLGSRLSHEGVLSSDSKGSSKLTYDLLRLVACASTTALLPIGVLTISSIEQGIFCWGQDDNNVGVWHGGSKPSQGVSEWRAEPYRHIRHINPFVSHAFALSNLCPSNSLISYEDCKTLFSNKPLCAFASQPRVCTDPSSENLVSKPCSSGCTSPYNGPVQEFPPGYKAQVGKLQTFTLPTQVNGTESDKLGKELVAALQRDGILQVAMTPKQQALYKAANDASKRFFQKPYYQKAACVDSQSYAGYIASGEELTDGVADYSEIFTVTKDLELDDSRVLEKWPCHGRCPWPDADLRDPMRAYMDTLNESGEKLLALLEQGLEVPPGALTNLTRDGWHHMRILRFPATNDTNGSGKEGRGIGSHTDYGLLVIAAADEVGALFIRPPRKNESFANWKESAAGFKEDDDGWVFVPPMENIFTVFPGDMMQYMTNSALPSTPHKVGLNTEERFAFAYFHEPSFQAIVRPLPGYDVNQEPREGIHYGKHFTDMFIRNYPERITTKRLQSEGRYRLLEKESLRTM